MWLQPQKRGRMPGAAWVKGTLGSKRWGTNRSQRKIQIQEARRTNVEPQNTWCSFCVTGTTLFLTRNTRKMQLNDLKKKKKASCRKNLLICIPKYIHWQMHLFRIVRIPIYCCQGYWVKIRGTPFTFYLAREKVICLWNINKTIHTNKTEEMKENTQANHKRRH